MTAFGSNGVTCGIEFLNYIYDHLNAHISRTVRNKQVTNGGTIPKWLLFNPIQAGGSAP